MKKVLLSVSLATGIFAMSCTSAPATRSAAAPTVTPAATAPARSLYQRLGGFDAIAAVTDDFLGRMIADRQLGRFFVGLSNNSKDVLRQHIVEFLCSETGGPCRYVGRDLGEVHTGLGISESDWTDAMKHLRATLAKFAVPPAETEELMGAVQKYREDIVGR